MTKGPAVTSSSLALAVVMACLMTFVASTPTNLIEPLVPLDEMDSSHACLFICSICFPEPEDTQHLLDCSNSVCGAMMSGFCPMEKFIWLGHHCRHYSNLDIMWSGNTNH